MLSFQHLLGGFDPAVRSTTQPPSIPAPIFVIGAPRSGSTLLFQLLVQRYRLCYISNLMALMPRYMVRLCQLRPAFCTGFTGAPRESHFGYVPGLLAPNEAGAVVRHWLDDRAGHEHDGRVRATVAALSAASGGPLLAKNLRITLRLDRMLALFPDARLLFLRRDPLMTAQSLLFVRRRLYGDDSHWWSVEPPGVDLIRERDPFYQVLWQVDAMEQAAIEGCLSHPRQSVLIDYADLCRSPDRLLDALGMRLGLMPTCNEPVPAGVKESYSQRLTPAEWDRLGRLWDEHYAVRSYVRSERSAPLRLNLGNAHSANG